MILWLVVDRTLMAWIVVAVLAACVAWPIAHMLALVGAAYVPPPRMPRRRRRT